LNDDEKEVDHTDWYEAKLIIFREFLNGIETWMDEDPKYAIENVLEGPNDSVSQATDKSCCHFYKSFCYTFLIHSVC